MMRAKTVRSRVLTVFWRGAAIGVVLSACGSQDGTFNVLNGDASVGGDASREGFCAAYARMCPGDRSAARSIAECQQTCEREQRMTTERCWFRACGVETGFCDNQSPGDRPIIACAERHGWYTGGCTPVCGTRVCGDDPVCGTSCGTCPTGQSCRSGACECVPSCGARECGGDGCGGSCGSCPSGRTCNASGTCVSATPACTLRAFEMCTVGANPCCGSAFDGTPTLCTVQSGYAFCSPRCTSDTYCNSLLGGGQLYCGTRNDGSRVCVFR